MEEALIIQALQVTDRSLGAALEKNNQGLWRVLLDSLKGYNGLMVEKGQWRKLASQSEGGFQSQNQGGGDKGGEQGQIWTYLMPELAAFAFSLVVGMKERGSTLRGWLEQPEGRNSWLLAGGDSSSRSFSVGLCWLGPLLSTPRSP